MNIPIEFVPDSKVYFDRQCPNKESEFIFKIHINDWKEKVSDEAVHCPMCSLIAPSDQWYTYEQLDGIRNIANSWAMSYLQDELNKSFNKLANSTRNNKFMKLHTRLAIKYLL